ncbi:hypothetical protein KSP40_PGU005875 [Platanthera guangdongensis]|uniref:NAB domain-containing protein n=1 Tax=Platanthera guangdongensis TaxID=2320717 RepID=A0ABR2MEI3_9ASPA
MSTLIPSESRRLYSWLWDSHNSPKNSKWLQENLTDMDLKVKAMIILIEEDADSFGKRAEMYYKKRPELMKLVEEFYRAYRALAERYNHATGALSHAHRTIAAAFPNDVPLALSDESLSFSPGIEMGPYTPEIPSPLRPLFDPNDPHRDALGAPRYFHTVNRNVAYAEDASFETKKGLKQLNDMFAPRDGISRVNLHEGKARKGLNFQEEDENIPLSKVHPEPKTLPDKEVKEKIDARNVIEHLQEQVSQLSIENKKLKIHIDSESTNSDLSRTEVQNLRDEITKLKSEKQAIYLQNQLSQEKISSMENEISGTKYEFGKLHEEIVMGIVKLCSAEEQCLSLEKANLSLMLELEQGKQLLEEIKSQSIQNQNQLKQEARDKENTKKDVKHFQEKLLQVSEENQNLKIQLQKETNHLQTSIVEVQNMRDAMLKLESEKEAALLQSQLFRESLFSLEAEKFQAKNEIVKLHAEVLMGIFKLRSAEEQYLALEKVNQGQKLEFEQNKRVLDETRSQSVKNQNRFEQIVRDMERAKKEVKHFQEQLLQLSNENQNLKIQLQNETTHLQLSRDEVENMRDAISKLESSKEAVLLQSQLLQKSISSLEMENFQAKNEVGKLHVEILTGIFKLSSAEEQYLALEKTNQGLKLELEEWKGELEEIQMLSVESQSLLEQEVKEKEKVIYEMECLQGEISQLSIENQNLECEIVSKSNHLGAYSTEVQALRNMISILEIEKKNAVSESQISWESVTSLESEIFRAKEEIMKLHAEVLMGIAKLGSAEEKHLALENANDNLKSENEKLKERLEGIKISLIESDKQKVEAEISLQSWEKLYNLSQETVEHMTLEIQIHFTILKDIENSKMGLEEEIRQLKDVNFNLNEYNLAHDLKLKRLQAEIVSLNEINHKFKDEINIHLADNRVLQQELDCIKDNRNELVMKHESLVGQLEVASLNMESLEILIKELQFGCAELSEGCQKLEDEKLLLLNKIQDMGSISTRNVVLKDSLSDAMDKIRVLEDSCVLLNTKNSTHVVEKAALASQIEVITRNMEKLCEKNVLLENSLADVNTELEGLRLKLKKLEESSQFISDENSNLLVQKNALVSQVESIQYDWTNLKTKHAMLEVDYLNLEKAKEVSVVQFMELEVALKVKKKEHESLLQSSKLSLLSLENRIHLLQEDSRFKEEELEVVQQKCSSYILEILILQLCLSDMKDSFQIEKEKQKSLIQSSGIQMAALENEIHLLQEKGHVRDEEFEKEQQKYMSSILENFLLQSCLSEMKDKNFILSRKCQQHIEASRSAGELISHLESSKLLLKEKNTVLVDHNARLVDGIGLLLESLDINKKSVDTDGSEDVFIETIKDEINLLLACISDLTDENQRLHYELSVFRTFLGQISLEKIFLGQEFGRMEGQLLVLLRDQDQLFERWEKLRQDLNDKEQMNESSKAEVDSLCILLSDLSKNFSILREENNGLEVENDAIIEEAMTLEHLYLLFSSSNAECLQSLKVLGDGIGSLVAVKNDHEREIIESKERLKVAENERKLLKESLALLEELISQTTVLEVDLFTTRLLSEDLIHHVENAENLLKINNMEFLNAYNKLQCTQEEITELHTKIDATNKEVIEAKMMRVLFEERIAILLKSNTHKDAEIVIINEKNRMLDEKLNNLNGIVEVLRKSEHNLSSVLQNKVDELGRCEGEILNLLNEIQVSAVNEAVFEDKMFEWAVASEVLEIYVLVQRKILNEGITLTKANSFELKKKYDDLAKENSELKAIWSECLPLYISLDNGIATVEKHARQLANLHEDQNLPLTDHQEETIDETRKGDLPAVAGVLVVLQNLVSRVESIEKLMTDTRNHLEYERFLHASPSEARRRETEGLNTEGSDQDENQSGQTSRTKNGQLMKDIELDQVSNSIAPSRIQSAESEDQMLKLWETAEKDYNNSVSNHHDIEEFDVDFPSSGIAAEKDLGVDKLEKSTKESQEDWNRRLMERLSTDAWKLSALMTTVKELEEKMERSGTGKVLDSSKLEVMQKKVKQAEKEILELVDTKEKLTKKVEEYLKPSNRERTRWLDRMQVFEQAQMELDRIEKLEMELQEIYFSFAHLKEEAERGKTRENDRKPRVLLRDYINGWRVVKARKKGHLCGCMRPKIEE